MWCAGFIHRLLYMQKSSLMPDLRFCPTPWTIAYCISDSDTHPQYLVMGRGKLRMRCVPPTLPPHLRRNQLHIAKEFMSDRPVGCGDQSVSAAVSVFSTSLHLTRSSGDLRERERDLFVSFCILISLLHCHPQLYLEEIKSLITDWLL